MSSPPSSKQTIKLIELIDWLKKIRKVYPETTITNVVDIRVMPFDTPIAIIKTTNVDNKLH
jgi:hypothetical protein